MWMMILHLKGNFMKNFIFIILFLVISCDNSKDLSAINGYYLGMSKSEVLALDNINKKVTLNNIEGEIYIRYCNGSFSEEVGAILIKTHKPKEFLNELNRKHTYNNKENHFKLIILSSSMDMLPTSDTLVGVWSTKMSYLSELSILMCNE